LEQHLMSCEQCLEELETLRHMNQAMALHPVTEIDPNLLAQSRMRLDEALDAIPQGGFLMRLRADALAWVGHLKGAPALATLLVGIGFLSGNFTHRWQDDHAPKPPTTVVLTRPGGGVSTVSGISRLPNDTIRVSYNRIVHEEAEGSLDDPQIRSLILVGTSAADNNGVRADSVSLLATECRDGHSARALDVMAGCREALLASLHSDLNPGVRSKALDGLQPYVSQDERVRDAVSQALITDPSAMVRTKAFDVLKPVIADTSVRQAVQAASTTDENPYIRTVSTEALRNSASLQ
jgi:hypothetical protein